MFTSIEEAIQFIASEKVAMVDLKVSDITGRWRHITVPAARFAESHFEHGVGFDGSAGSGYRGVEDGDLAARPVADTAFMDPFFELPTLSFLCNVVSADTRTPLPTDPRTIAAKAESYLKQSGIADTIWMAPEYEFHIFERVRVVSAPFETAVEICSGEAQDAGVAPGIRAGQGYGSAPPTEGLHNLRGEMAAVLENLGVKVRYHHHEVGACGQCEIEVELENLLTAADHAMLVKYVVKNVAARHGMVATFMPKPLFGEAGNGMHVHQRLTKGVSPIFYDPDQESYAQLSQCAIRYVLGMLAHGRALCGITNPSTNSYKRLVPNHEAPVNLFYSLANRSAAVRIPRYATAPDEKRIEYRTADFTGNVYLSLAAMLMAGLDGVLSQLDLVAHQFGPFDVDVAQQNAAFVEKIAAMPHSLSEAMSALEKDHSFLLAGEVFSEPFVKSWIDKHRRVDVAEVALRPHPREYELYLDA
ncbi:MAG: type I glutamate--ammonia ligase [Planctomycetota bacterium]